MLDPVRRYMTTGVQTIGSRHTMATAHRIMREHGIRHLPVMFEGRLVGLVTERDLHLVETLKDTNPEVVRVEEAMTPDPFTAPSDAPVAEVASVMAEHKYGCAIITEEGEIVGIFTTVDALRAVVTLSKRRV